jgi:hypothetical protein
MKFDGFDWVFLTIPIFIIVAAAAVLTYGDQQQRVLFQQTYNKNLECRQALKDQTVGRVNEICGDVPAIGAFVK